MKHTSFIPMDACSQEWRDPNDISKSPPDGGGGRWLRMMMRCLGLFVFLLLGSQQLMAQYPYVADPLYGSGASRISAYYDLDLDYTDPCTCADDIDGKVMFDDEIIVISYDPADQWVLDNTAPNITMGACVRGTSTPVALGIPFLLKEVTIDTHFNVPAYVYSLPISHEAGEGYKATVMPGDLATAGRYTPPSVMLPPADPDPPADPPIPDAEAGFPYPFMVENTCTKVEVALDLSGLPDVSCDGIGTGDGIPDISLPVTEDVTIDVLNEQTGNPILGHLTSLATLPEGNTASIYVGTANNKRKILLEQLTDTDALTSTISVDFDPSGALAIGCFNPIEDTLITFVYNADTSAQSHVVDNLVDPFGNSIENDPGCEDEVCERVDWNSCNAGPNAYRVGGTLQKYDGQRRVFTVCPCDPNKQVAQIAFT